ncbi:MAG TPA: alpha/beta hydrolase [Pseudonocardiaceae bacterium]|nr:alpha/beta hydrolase [Pseudonocardiaceae bacterium]
MAKADLAAKRKKLGDAAITLAKIPPILTNLSQTLVPLHDQLRQDVFTAVANELEIESDGTVQPTPFVASPPESVPTPPPLPGQPPGSAPASPDPHQLASQLTSQIQDILRTASMADEEAAAALRNLTAQATGLAPAANDPGLTASATAIPGPNTSPADVRKWWDSLSAQQQESLLFMHGDQLGAMDGIPAVVRDRVNRDVLAELESRLGEEKVRLETKSQPLSDADQAQLNDFNGKLGGMQAIDQRLAVQPSAAQQQPFLLKIGVQGGGRAVVAMGNPDTATNVATFVPGTSASLATCGGLLTRSDLMGQAAAKANSPSTSVITWIGYDAPPTFPDAAFDSYARDAEPALTRFQDGLRATHDGPPSHNVMIGHSYGTTAIGYAAHDGSLNANDLVFVASPGVDANRPADLHLDGVDPSQMGQHIYATTAKHDIINVVDGWFGPNPSDAGFGDQVFTSNPGAAGSLFGDSFAVHSQYWDSGNRALDNMGKIIAGMSTN